MMALRLFRMIQLITPQQSILVHTNNYLTERFKECDMANLIVPDSFNRVDRIRTLINDKYGFHLRRKL